VTRDEHRPARGAALTVLVPTALAALGIAFGQWSSGRPPRYVDDGVLAFSAAA